MNTKLYTGNGATSSAGTLARTITGVGFEPSLTWVKERTSITGGYTSHSLHDAVRTAPMTIESNSTSAEQNVTTQYGNGGIGSFTSDGFGIHSGHAGNSDNFNVNSGNYVSWNWKANGAGSANTDGTASNVTVSANQTAGFSIVQFDATQSRVSVGHGLGSTPDAIIMKETEGSGGWVVGGFGLDWSGYLSLQSTNAFNNDSNDSSGTGRMFTPDGYAPTASVWSTNGSAFLSGGTKTCIAYCFKSIPGYSAFTSYVGTGDTNGAFIYTGFRPAFVMVKRTDSTNNWVIYDNKRPNSFNEITHALLANSSDAEHTSTSDDDCDFLSNGVKMRCTNNASNGGGASYIFMAFAEAPLVGTNNIPCNAR